MSSFFTVRNVGYDHENQVILHDVSFDVAEGDFLTIAGPSGSGKSTLLKILATLATQTSGEILREGAPIESYDKVAYRREVSYCFQQPRLFGDTVRDNFEFPFSIRKTPFDEELVRRHLRQMKLEESKLDASISSLSGGEKQRVALIRNVLFPPKALLLDEITAGLDVQTKEVITGIIADLNEQRGITVVSVTHDEGEIAAARQLLTLRGGTVAQTKAGEQK